MVLRSLSMLAGFFLGVATFESVVLGTARRVQGCNGVGVPSFSGTGRLLPALSNPASKSLSSLCLSIRSMLDRLSKPRFGKRWSGPKRVFKSAKTLRGANVPLLLLCLRSNSRFLEHTKESQRELCLGQVCTAGHIDPKALFPWPTHTHRRFVLVLTFVVSASASLSFVSGLCPVSKALFDLSLDQDASGRRTFYWPKRASPC